MLYIVFLSLVSLFDSCVLLLWFVPLNFLLIVENMLSILFLFMYILCRNIVGLFSLYCPFFALFLRGIWSNALSSSFMHFLIGSVSYALSATMYCGLYFLICLNAGFANCVSYFGPRDV